LLLDLGDQLFVSLAEIINKRLSRFKTYRLEIETNIAVMLSQITQVTGDPSDALNVAARRRVVQQGFVDSFVNRCSELTYKIELQPDEDFDLDEDDYPGKDIDLAQGFEDLDFDDVDRVTDGNQLIEYTMLLIANATELHENQYALISQECLMMHFVVTLAK
jgi:hypothetical protein